VIRVRLWAAGAVLILAAGCTRTGQAALPVKPATAAVSLGSIAHVPLPPARVHLGPEQPAASPVVKLSSTKKGAYSDKVFYNNANAGKQVALTFDDGPDNRITPIILDILKQNGVKATFFLIGQQASTYPDMVKKIVANGHAIGNHSWSHPDFARISPERAGKEIAKTQDELNDILGYKPSLFRPPYGELKAGDEPVISQAGMHVVNWSVDTRDWAGTPTKQILAFVHKQLRPGGIILQHCSGGGKGHLANTVAALKLIIPELKKQGYSFVTVPELLDLPSTLPKTAVKG
jgi:peptidoglycan/xylan/chitin deacetylase (PgdA/CDA1 family)